MSISVFCDVPLCTLVGELSFTLKTDANGSSEKCQTSRRHIAEDSIFGVLLLTCTVHEYLVCMLPTTGICWSIGLRIFVVFIGTLEKRQVADHPLLTNKQKV
jgi:hypothetical protein